MIKNNTKTDRITILFLIDSFRGMGGAEKNVLLLSQELNKRDYRCIVCCLKGGWLKTRLRQKGVQVVDLRIKRIYNARGITQLFKLIKFIRHEDVRLIVTYHEASDFLGLMAAKLTGRPIISQRRDMGHNLKKRHIIMYRILNSLFDRIITVSNAVKQIIVDREKTPSGKIVVINNGIEHQAFFRKESSTLGLKSQFGINPSERVVGMVADIRRIKGHRFFIEAASLISKKISNVKFLLVGGNFQEDDYSFRNVQEMASQHQLSEKLVYIGPSDNIPQALSIFDIAVLSSLNEGFPNTILEYMAAGKPIVATNVGGNPEIVVHRQTGLLVPPRNPEALASATLQLLKNQELAERMGKMGKKRVESLFPLVRMVDSYDFVYKSVLNSKKGRLVPWEVFNRGAIKLAKIAAGWLFYYSGLFHVFTALQSRVSALSQIKILAYHRVNNEQPYSPGLTVSVSNFTEQIKFLKRHNIVPLNEAVEMLRSGNKTPLNAIVITFDDGYRDNYSNAFPVLRRFNIPATIFLSVTNVNMHEDFWVDWVIKAVECNSKEVMDLTRLGLAKYRARNLREKEKTIQDILSRIKKLDRESAQRLIDYLRSEFLQFPSKIMYSEGPKILSWEEIKEMRKHNISFGSHSMNHVILTKLPLHEAAYQINKSKRVIEEKLGEEIHSFAYPNGSAEDFNREIVNLIEDSGYSCACTLIPGSNKTNADIYALRRYCVTEGMSTGFFGTFSPPLFALELSGFPFLLKNITRRLRLELLPLSRLLP